MPPDPLTTALRQIRWLGPATAGVVSDTLPLDWGMLVGALVQARLEHGPIPVMDPIAVLAVATKAALRSAPAGGADVGYRDVAAMVAGYRATQGEDRRAILYRIAFEAVHQVRLRTQQQEASGWLYAAERSLDVALCRPVEPTRTAAALAAWLPALAQLPAGDAARWAGAATQRTILREAAAAIDAVCLTSSIGPEVLTGIQQQLMDALTAFTPPAATPSLDAAARSLSMIGSALAAARHEPAEARAAAFLASHFGHVGVAATVLDAPRVRVAAQRLELSTLAWVAGQIQVLPQPAPDPAPLPAPAEPVAQPAPPDRTIRTSPQVTARELTDAGCTALAGDRDRGTLAAAALAGDTDAAARFAPGTDLHSIVDAGRAATAQLALSAAPMAEQVAHRAAPSNRDDVRADIHLRLLQAAQTFNPDLGRWYTYAHQWIHHAHSIYDSAGIPEPRRVRRIFAAESTLHGNLHREPSRQEIADAARSSTDHVDRTRLFQTTVLDEATIPHAPTVDSPESIYLAGHDQRALAVAISSLGRDQQAALLGRLDGLTLDQIAEQANVSPSTINRRLAEAINHLRAILTTHDGHHGALSSPHNQGILTHDASRPGYRDERGIDW